MFTLDIAFGGHHHDENWDRIGRISEIIKDNVKYIFFPTKFNCDIWSENIWGSDEIEFAYLLGGISFTLKRKRKRKRKENMQILKGNSQSIFGILRKLPCNFPWRMTYVAIHLLCTAISLQLPLLNIFSSK